MAKYDISDEYDFNKDQTGVYLLLRANGFFQFYEIEGSKY